MGFYGEHILPRLVDRLLGNPYYDRLRRHTLVGLEGRVLEIGFGSGRNLPFYPEDVEELLVVEPTEVAVRMAAERVRAAPFPVRTIGEVAETIPLPEASVDGVACTWTLCSIPDLERALREVLRVLKPGGRFHFLEHGLAPDPGVARWQARLTPIHRRLAGGCHLDRPIDRLVAASGLRLVRRERWYDRGPRVAACFYRGIGVRPTEDEADPESAPPPPSR